MFKITFTPEAIEDLRWFKKAERRRILAELESRLSSEPAVETRNRKRLRPNRLAEWELRVDRFRVFFDTDQENQLIKVEAVGYKRGSCLYIQDREYEL
ncbi:MAG: type II toxin-antitoxin system RelE/ParE family toxin [Acidobacteria bacterium]|nr:type II toxin-antitoxin system RelE/ParE family toxin [Acidobacteriota bacterium]